MRPQYGEFVFQSRWAEPLLHEFPALPWHLVTQKDTVDSSHALTDRKYLVMLLQLLAAGRTLA